MCEFEWVTLSCIDDLVEIQSNSFDTMALGRVKIEKWMGPLVANRAPDELTIKSLNTSLPKSASKCNIWIFNTFIHLLGNTIVNIHCLLCNMSKCWDDIEWKLKSISFHFLLTLRFANSEMSSRNRRHWVNQCIHFHEDPPSFVQHWKQENLAQFWQQNSKSWLFSSASRLLWKLMQAKW